MLGKHKYIKIMDCVIGHTGFVGGILKKSIIGDYFNRENIGNILNNFYDTIYCSGVISIKWWANKYPNEDAQNIKNLLEIIRNVNCNKFILISTN